MTSTEDTVPQQETGTGTAPVDADANNARMPEAPAAEDTAAPGGNTPDAQQGNDDAENVKEYDEAAASENDQSPPAQAPVIVRPPQQVVEERVQQRPAAPSGFVWCTMATPTKH